MAAAQSSDDALLIHAPSPLPAVDNDNDENVRIALTALGDMRAAAARAQPGPGSSDSSVPASPHASSATPSLLTVSATTAAAASTISLETQAASLALSPPRGESSDPHEGQAGSSPPNDYVSRIPFATTALKAIEYGRQNSRVVEYGAGMVESGLRTLSRPVIDRLPTRVLNYGRHAPPQEEPNSMQVDSSERESSSSSERGPNEHQRRIMHSRAFNWTQEQNRHREEGSSNQDSSGSGESRVRHPSLLPPISTIPPQTEQAGHASSSTSRRTAGKSPGDHTSTEDDSREAMDTDTIATTSEPRNPRSRWQGAMMEAGAAGIAMKPEGVKQLRYCLQWLQFANSNLDNQIKLIESFIRSVDSTVTGEPVPPTAIISPEALRHFTRIKRNVVQTMRQVVEVVSRYAGGALPEPAKQRVKGFILALPRRWSTAVQDAGLGDGWESGPGGEGSHEHAPRTSENRPPPSNPRKRHHSRVNSPGTSFNRLEAGPSGSSVSDSSHLSTESNPKLPPTAGAARLAAHRILTLAQEGLHSVRGAMGIFQETLERAEVWVDRLGGMPYTPHSIDDSSSSEYGRPMLPSLSVPSSMPLSPSTSSPGSPVANRRYGRSPRDLHLEALARSIPSVGPYGPYGTTPPMSPVLGPTASTSNVNNPSSDSFPFHNPAPGYGWVGGGRSRTTRDRSESIPTLNLSVGGRSRAGSFYSSTGESLPPPSAPGSSIGGDDELDDGMDDEGDFRMRKRRRRDEE